MKQYKTISQRALDDYNKKCEDFTNRIMSAVYHERIKHGFSTRLDIMTRFEISLNLKTIFGERSNGKKNAKRLGR